jgi:hypothetical protein
VKDEEDGKCDTTESRGVVPLYFLAEIEDREDGEDRESDDFLNGLQLRGAEFIRANAIRRNLEAVFEKSNSPAHQDHFPKSGSAEPEVAVPGKGHEDIRNGEKDDGSHVFPFSLCCEMCSS